MQYVKLGHTGLEVSPICIGCMGFGEPSRGYPAWSLDEDASRPLIRDAIEAGINFFATANTYSNGSSEKILGRALTEFSNRDSVVIATKLSAPTRNGPNALGSVTQGDHDGDRPQPETAWDRLRRPLPDPSSRPENALGRDAGGAP